MTDTPTAPPCAHEWVWSFVKMPEGYGKPIGPQRCHKCGATKPSDQKIDESLGLSENLLVTAPDTPTPPSLRERLLDDAGTLKKLRGRVLTDGEMIRIEEILREAADTLAQLAQERDNEHKWRLAQQQTLDDWQKQIRTLQADLTTLRRERDEAKQDLEDANTHWREHLHTTEAERDRLQAELATLRPC